MNDDAKICPQCNSGSLVGGVCDVCGYNYLTQQIADDVPATDGSANPVQNRKALWGWFWVSFIATPVLSLLTLQAGGIMLLLFGALIAGFSLARLIAKSDAGVIFGGLVLSVGVLMVYLAIAFVGCLVMVNGRHF